MSQPSRAGTHLSLVSICLSATLHELCCPGARLLPDVPPAFQVPSNHLHGDTLLEADLVFALAGVGLHSDILLFCESGVSEKARLI